MSVDGVGDESFSDYVEDAGDTVADTDESQWVEEPSLAELPDFGELIEEDGFEEGDLLEDFALEDIGDEFVEMDPNGPS